MNNLNQILAFFGASWAFAALVEGTTWGGSSPGPHMGHGGAGGGLGGGMSPVLDLTYRLNEWALVQGSALHTWAGALEAQAMAMTQTILDLDQGPGLVAVLVSVAVLPALCEEWLFRGTLQPILARGTATFTWPSGCRPRCSAQFTCSSLASCRGCFWAPSSGIWWRTAGAFGLPWWGTSRTTPGSSLWPHGWGPSGWTRVGAPGLVGVGSHGLGAGRWMFSIVDVGLARLRPSRRQRRLHFGPGAF